MKKILPTLIAVFLLLFALPAWSLGLGQLQLRSKLGEPLRAAIPVISANPQELENLQARLAEPDTFLRVGLPLPDKMVSDLRFALVYDAFDSPLIQVTSPGPVTMPMLTFLLEVDWGDGRLVREYSVLLAEPDAVAAVTQPVIEAPVAAPSNAIVRDVPADLPSFAPAQAQPPLPDSPAAPAQGTEGALVGFPASSPSSARRIVQAGESLSVVAAGLREPGQSLHAVMAALMRANPQAFINGDPNLLRRGAELEMPDAEAIAQAGADGAASAMQEQLAGWRRMRGQRMDAVDMANAATAANKPVQASLPRRSRDARLEIMPATTSAAAGKSTKSGTGGEGGAEMTQQLQEARETIATRDAEVAELKSRVAQLESLQQQQAQLVQMKDGQLAAAQQQLQQRQQTAAASTPVAADAGSPWVWALVVGVPLIALLVLLAWWMQRRKPLASHGVEPSFVKNVQGKDSPAKTNRLSGDMDLFKAGDADESQKIRVAANPPSPSTSLGKPSWMGVAAKGDVVSPAGEGALRPSPQGLSERLGAGPQSPASVSRNRPVMPDAVPSIHNDSMPYELPPGMGVFDSPDALADPLEYFASRIRDERIDLASTYLQLDDEATARQLLQEVIDEGGANADEARRLLGRIGQQP